MDRRSFLRFLGVAPVAPPAVVEAPEVNVWRRALLGDDRGVITGLKGT